jgi:tetratricopeptide (TPR) repeat protein
MCNESDALQLILSYRFEDSMRIRSNLSRVGLMAVLISALSACSTTSTTQQAAAPTLKDYLTHADQAAAGGNKEQAVTLWKEGATAFPKDKAPWSRIAQTRFEAGQYGDAIQAALEVLVRDPNDTLANSIVAVSGLRLSTRALGDLSRQNNLTGTTKSESQELAKLLRETLGETVLVDRQPVGPAVTPQPVHKNPPVRPGRKGNAKRNAEPADQGGSANPFQALK